MAYQTGTAKNVADLLTKLSDFANSLGWSTNKLTSTALFINNADGYWAMEFKDGLLFTIAATGYDGTRDCFNQPGSSSVNSYANVKTCTSQLGTGDYVSYDFFGTSQYLHICVQIKNEVFRHFGMGTLNKEGEYTGGQYAFGTYLNYGSYYIGELSSYHVFGFSHGAQSYGPVLRADRIAGGHASPWYFINDYREDYAKLDKSAYGAYMLTNGRADGYWNHPDVWLLISSQSNFGQAVIPVPNAPIALCKDGLFRRLGVLPDRYQCRLNNIYPRQRLQINGESWMFIPSAKYQKGNPSVSADKSDNSGEYGVAYRIVE
ncbi:hypothetical protein IFE17_09370 [Actinobacillus sp. GY-402]|nr:hypothetical protein IFE17_09370 [Actinobacillus sp. GY-402]